MNIPNELGVVLELAEHSIDFHCHGVGRFDFTEIAQIDLDEIEKILATRQQKSILTLYLPKPGFESFLELLTKYDEGKKLGHYQHIAGFGLEGPLLASHGGTPEEGVWMPSKTEWHIIAQCGKKGLIYVIMSPDAALPGSNFKFTYDSPTITWIAEALLEGGVLPAPGHFIKSDPVASAKVLQSIFDVVAAWGQGATITDHLYNDMPHNFKHAWRTPEEKIKRDQEIALLNLDQWSLATLEENLGVVPATIIRNAKKGLVKICQNFDGEHVDLAIVKRTVELVGTENMLVMTDSIESKRLAGRDLHMHADSTLLYQDQNIVAAGSQGMISQINNMLSMGLDYQQIKMLVNFVPNQILRQHHQYINKVAHAQADYI